VGKHGSSSGPAPAEPGATCPLAALYLVAGLRLVPRRGAVVRIAAITVSYLVVAAGIDRLTGGDYLGREEDRTGK
jgi:hypothetical protein